MALVYTGVNDVNEPNDDNAHATPLTLGTPAKGYLLAGFEQSTAPTDSAWEDRFKLTLPATGALRVVLSDLPSGDTGINGAVTLYNSLGQTLDSAYDVTHGASVVLDFTLTAAAAGDAIVVVKPFTKPALVAGGSTLPTFVSQPYTLTATVQ